MVVIRLARFGRKKAPYYKIAVDNKKSKATGKVIEYIGTWNPDKKVRQIDKDRLSYWLGQGAKVSAAAQKVLDK